MVTKLYCDFYINSIFGECNLLGILTFWIKKYIFKYIDYIVIFSN